MIEFIYERKAHILANLLLLIIITLVLLIAKLNLSIIILVDVVIVLTFFIPFLSDYHKRRQFFKEFNYIIQELDNKMYVSSIIEDADFYEAKIFLDEIYLINKQMIERVKEIKDNREDFKEYVEMWCHEIKTPLSTLKLIIENNKDQVTLNILEEVVSVENFIEQVLYYTRSEVIEKDLILKPVSLQSVINSVIKRNKKDILEKKLRLSVNCEELLVISDTKWLEYIVNQIVNNSIKYSLSKGELLFKATNNENNITLDIIDYGRGIKKEELSRVTEKSFTGTNGRLDKQATGIGLYLVKKMCLGLGHQFEIESIENEYTKATIVFPINSMTKNLNLTKL